MSKDAEKIHLVGGIAEREHRIILVGKAGIGVHMGPQVGAVFLLQFDEFAVKIAVGSSPVDEGHSVADTVGLLKFPVGEHIQIDIDALFLQAGKQIIQPVEGFGIISPGILHPLALFQLIDAGGSPFRIHLVQTNHIAAIGCQPFGQLFGVGLLREAGTGVQIGAPKAHRGAVFKDKPVSLHFQKAMLARGFLFFKQIGDIDGRKIVIRRKRDVFCHIDRPSKK